MLHLFYEAKSTNEWISAGNKCMERNVLKTDSWNIAELKAKVSINMDFWWSVILQRYIHRPAGTRPIPYLFSLTARWRYYRRRNLLSFGPRVEVGVSAECKKMDKKQLRSVIRFWFLERKLRNASISKECVGYILEEILRMRKLSARWVPRLLTHDSRLTKSH